MDHSRRLPDEVLCHVFSYVSSILTRIRLAAVNHKFRRCIFNEMKKPAPLEIELTLGYLSGHSLPLDKWLSVVELLAKEARFSQIRINFLSSPVRQELLADIFNALATSKDCLTRVTQLLVHVGDSEHLKTRTANGLASVIEKCEKLSVLQLIFKQVPVSCHKVWHTLHSPLDLVAALKEKSITQLNVKLVRYTQQEAIGLFRAIKPNTLRKLKMNLEIVEGLEQDVGMGNLMRELCLIAAHSLEEIEFEGKLVPDKPSFFFHRALPTADSFSYISQLPALRSLSTTGQGLVSIHQFVAALQSLLGNHGRSTPLVVQYIDFELNALENCQLLTRIRQLEKVVPNLVFGYDQKIGMMTLRLGNVAIGLHGLDSSCHNPNCHECRSCFPVVKHALTQRADNEMDAHLENHWLDRCTIGQVAGELNRFKSPFHHWRAVQAVENQPQQLASITFRSRNGTEFEITVNTGRCFDNSCVRCLDI